MSLHGQVEFHDPLVRRTHFIRRWLPDVERYECECGHWSTTATDHELHERSEQRKAQR